MLSDFSFELVGLMNTDTTPYGFAVDKKYQSRHRLHTITLCKLSVFINIYLDDIGALAHLCLDIGKNRTLHAARTTPCSKEINKRRLAVFYHFIKIVHIIAF